ncbi:hypothetical protein [Moorena sp. SIOASIH]|nr:hypothetical protein [Moorena sp. SIOASIH]
MHLHSLPTIKAQRNQVSSPGETPKTALHRCSLLPAPFAKVLI